MSKSYIAEVICVLLPKFLFLLEPGECWRGFVQDKVHTPLMCGGIQRGSKSRPKPKGIPERNNLFCSFLFPPQLSFAFCFSSVFTFRQRVQCVPRGCPQKLPWTTQRVQSIRKPHTHTHTDRQKRKSWLPTQKTLCGYSLSLSLWCVCVCVCGVPKPVLKNVAECSQHGMTWDRPKSWKMAFWKRKWPFPYQTIFSVGVWDLLSNANFHKLRIWDAKKRKKSKKKAIIVICRQKTLPKKEILQEAFGVIVIFLHPG